MIPPDGAVRFIALVDPVAAVRGSAAEFRHVGAMIVPRDDPLDAIAETRRDGASALVVASDLPGHAAARVIELAAIACDAPVFLGLGRDVDEQSIRDAFAAGARGTVALPLTPDRVARLVRTLPGVRAEDATSDPVYAAGDLVVDTRRHLITWRGEIIAAPPQEFAALLTLARAYPYLATIDEIAQQYIGNRSDPYLAARRIIRRIRVRLSESPTAGELAVQTVVGVGYRLAC